MKVYKEYISEEGFYDIEQVLSKEDWKEVLQHPSFETYHEVLYKFYQEDNHQSTCKNLSEKFGKDSQYYNAKVTAFAKAVQNYFNRFEIINLAGKPTYWIIVMKGRKLNNGLFEWTMRNELAEAIKELNINLENSSYIRFKKLLEYFVAHLNFLVNEEENKQGYEEYIKPLIESGAFKKTGQGYFGATIQKQISNWENYDSGKICINIQPNYGDYKTVKCYLNWLDTGINIVANWKDNTILGLYLDEFINWEKPTRRVDLKCSFTLEELGLYQNDIITNELKTFFENFVNAHERIKNNELKKKLMAPILKIKSILEYKKQIILQGPPGTGKTRLAKILANQLIGLPQSINDSDILKFLRKGLKVKTNAGLVFYLINEIDVEKKRVLVHRESGTDDYTKFDEIITAFSQKLWEQKIDQNAPRRAASIAKYIYDEYIKLDKIEQYKIIQFHPSYTYEDFVRGIVSKASEDGKSIMYKAENMLLGNLAKEALENPSSDYVLIIDEINRANLSSVLGELIYALEYRGEAVESMYKVDKENKIILPPNLYIIGTMNTADRSVGHIDYAIRRRFAFVDVLPQDLTNQLEEGQFYTDLFRSVQSLFTTDDYENRSSFLESDFNPKDVALGHSYFIDQSKSKAGADIKMRWQYEIKPILLEYVRDGILKETALVKINEIENSLL